MNIQTKTSSLNCPKHLQVKFKKLGKNLYCELCEKENIRPIPQYQYALKKDIVNKKLNYKRLGIPDRYAAASFDNYNVKFRPQGLIYKGIRQFTEEVTKGAIKNMMLLGTVGTGKTHLSCSMLIELASKGVKVRYIKSNDLATYFVENWKNNIFYESNEIMNFVNYDLLVIDEYGLNDQKDFQKVYIDKIIFARYENKKSTVLISNLAKQDVQDSLGARLWSRMNEDGLTIHEFAWPDFRLNHS